MALATRLIDLEAPTLEPYLLDKHYLRKHGPAAYYGQTSNSPAGLDMEP
jgi:L-ribulose-5-phosphate 4-epimerase